jgi:8-oxo-dGTP pyrophosphatase MutT (NUDIX family)
MRPERLRSRLARPAISPGAAAGIAAIDGDEGHAQRHQTGGRVPAAVLLGLVARAEGPCVLLTLRTAHLKDHAGQISLPGGRIETTDADPVAAALREAQEEIGLDPSGVEVVGELPVYDTITGFRIHPVVGWIERPALLVPDPFEVAEVFEVPLGFALDARNHERDSYERDGRRREFYVLRWQGRYIWGATAGILVNFARLMAD